MKRLWRPMLWLLSFAVLLGLLFLRPATQAELQIYFLDVGQGDAALIRTPSGDILIDAGPDAAEEELLLRLSRLGVKRLSLLILSHTDEDHVGGADGILREIPVDEVWVGAGSAFDEPYRRVLQAVEAGKIPISTPVAGESYECCGLDLFILAPIPLSGQLGNNGSLVLRLSYRDEVSALFTGDVDGVVEREILARYSSRISSDIYKVPHHGSATGENNQLLSAVRPHYAVISCGVGNSYGHPHGETLSLLHASGAEVLRTDRRGEILIEYDGTELKLAP